MVGRGGFEPPKSETTDLQSVAFDRSATYPNATTILVVYYFAIVFWVEYCRSWSWWSESNQQPADYKSAALPLSHTSMVSGKVH